MEELAIFEEICKDLNLGTIVGQVTSVSGGYMHKVYKMQTDGGNFALKLLNPAVMKRENAFNNYKLADNLEAKLQWANIPILPALDFNGQKMQCVRNQFFYIFSWNNGKILKPEEIQKKHCKIIGKVLAQIHKIERKQDISQEEVLDIDWDFYVGLANEKCPEIASLLEKNKDFLYFSQEKSNKAHEKLPRVSCICNGDMDAKNVLWSADTPVVIDLESLNYGNPYTELLELALSWSGGEQLHINYDLLKSFIGSYIDEYGKVEADWNVLSHCNNNRLRWLEYNIKRALMIECESENERKLGIEQVSKTIEQIIYYYYTREGIVAEIKTFFA